MTPLREALTVQVLAQALARVRLHPGPGVDGVPAHALGPAELERLRAAVLAGTYRPSGLLRRERPKDSGGVRVLGIPTTTDRVLQGALNLLRGAALHARLSPRVHGYRPGRSVQGALRHLVAQVGARPALEVVHADVHSLFDTLPHDRVWSAVERADPDPLWLRLNRLWLDAWATAPGRGLPQGAPLSPLLANLTLAPLDAALDAALREPTLSCGARLAWARGTLRAALAGRTAGEGSGGPSGGADLVAWIRYGDDLVLAGARAGAGPRLLGWLDALVRQQGLQLSPSKTHLAARRHRLPLPRPVLGERLYFVQTPRGWSIQAAPGLAGL